MKRGLFLLLLTFQLQALPVGNPWGASLFCQGVCFDLPSLPSWVNIHIGYSGNYVIDKRLRGDEEHHQDTISQTRLTNNGGTLTANFYNRVEVFTTLGAFQASILSRSNSFNAPGSVGNEDFIILTDTYFSSSIGIRGTLWQSGCLGVGVEGEYFFSRPRLNSTRESLFNPDYFPGRCKYQEWQVALGVTYSVIIDPCQYSVLPYAALRLNGVKVDLGNAQIGLINTPLAKKFIDLENDQTLGYTVGLSILGAKNWLLNIEGGFANELSVNVTGEVRF